MTFPLGHPGNGDTPSLKTICHELDSIIAAIKLPNAETDLALLDQCSRRFCTYVSQFNEQTFRQFQASGDYAVYRNFFSEIEPLYVRRHEITEAIKIITLGQHATRDQIISIFSDEYLKELFKQTREEMQMLDLSDKGSSSSIVMVGSGAFPGTIMSILQDYPDMTITGLDTELTSVEVAKNVIKICKMEGADIKYKEGTNYHYSKADIVYIANFVSPKAALLKRIAATAQDNVQVLVRTPVGFGKMIYEEALSDDSDMFKLVKEGAVNPYFLFKALLLSPK